MNNSMRKRSCFIPKWETKKIPKPPPAIQTKRKEEKRDDQRQSVNAIECQQNWRPFLLLLLLLLLRRPIFFSFFTTKRLRLLFFSRGPDRSSAKDDTFRCGRSTAVVNLLEKRITTKRRSRERENMFQKKKRKRGEAVRFHWEMRSSSVPTGHQQSPFFFRRCSSFHRFLDSN